MKKEEARRLIKEIKYPSLSVVKAPQCPVCEHPMKGHEDGLRWVCTDQQCPQSKYPVTINGVHPFIVVKVKQAEVDDE